MVLVCGFVLMSCLWAVGLYLSPALRTRATRARLNYDYHPRDAADALAILGFGDWLFIHM